MENVRGTNVALVSWVTAVIMFFAVSIKIGTKIIVMRRLSVSTDGALILGAMLFALGQTGAISYAAQVGFGEHLSTLTSSQIQGYQQSIYAANILFIMTLCLTKLSIVAFFLQSTIGKPPRIVGGALGCFIIGWVIVSIFGLAFQCDLPHPWMFLQNTCFDRRAFWYFIGVLDVITDVCILALPFYTLRFLQINAKTRRKIIAPFFIRVIIIPLTVLRLYYLAKETNTSDPSFNTVISVLLEVVQMNVAIVVSCIPFSRLLITSVQSGLMTTNLRTHAPNFDGSAQFNLSMLGQKSSQSNGSRSQPSRLGAGLGSHPPSDNKSGRGWEISWKDVINTTQISKDGERRSGSPTDSERHIIRATTEWAVDRASLPEE